MTSTGFVSSRPHQELRRRCLLLVPLFALLACDAGIRESDDAQIQAERSLATTSEPSQATPSGGELCPFGWAQIDGDGSDDVLLASSGNTCIRSYEGIDTISASQGAALYAYAGGGDDTLNGANRRDGLIGGPGDDRITGGGMSDFIDGSEGNDKIDGEAGPDLIFGGDGADNVHGGEGPDQLWLGAGHDNGSGGPGNDVVYGGPGDDTAAGNDGDDLLHGGPGGDHLFGDDGEDHLGGGLGDDELDGGPGNDVLHGGPGLDKVYGRDGDDVIRISSPCEVRPGEVIDGGPGSDTLFSHQSEEELRNAGVKVSNVENFVLLKTRPSDVVCLHEQEDDGYAEVIGTVVREETFWRDDAHDFPLDGTSHYLVRGASLARHAVLSVESVISSTGSPVVQGGEVRLFRPGGHASFIDGTGLDMQACCEPEPVVGRRYRMALRWDQERDEYQYLYDAVGGGLDIPVAPLPVFGTLPFVPDAPQYQGPGPFCPLAPTAATFGSSEDAVGWAMNVADNVGRWAQDVDAEVFNPDWVGGFVAVPVLEAHSSVENVCDTGGFSEDYLTYIRSGFITWNDSPWLGALIGVALPGMTQNTIGSSSCIAGSLGPDNANGQADGVNCVAVVGEPDANGDLTVHELEESSSWNSSPNIAGLNARHITDPQNNEDWAGAHQVREADTIFRNNDIRHWEECEGGGGGGRLRDTAIHEAGHFLGLRHSDCVADAMFEGYPPAGHPSKQDFARVQILYPNPADELVFPDSIYVK